MVDGFRFGCETLLGGSGRLSKLVNNGDRRGF